MHRLLTLSVLVLALPAAATAGSEVTALVGYRGGSFDVSTGIACIEIVGQDCPTFASGDSDPGLAYGAILDLPVGEVLDFELLLNRQPGEMQLHDGFSRGRLSSFDLNLTTLQAGLRRSWRFKSFSPFGAFGAGFTQLASAPSVFGEIDETRVSASLAAGGRVDLSERLGVRFEARGYWVDLPEEFRPAVLTIGGNLTQYEATTGLVFRF